VEKGYSKKNTWSTLASLPKISEKVHYYYFTNGSNIMCKQSKPHSYTLLMLHIFILFWRTSLRRHDWLCLRSTVYQVSCRAHPGNKDRELVFWNCSCLRWHSVPFKPPWRWFWNALTIQTIVFINAEVCLGQMKKNSKCAWVKWKSILKMLNDPLTINIKAILLLD